MDNFKIALHHDDLPKKLEISNVIALNAKIVKGKLYYLQLTNEGLQLTNDGLQLTNGGDTVHIVQFTHNAPYDAPNLLNILANPEIQKIFHLDKDELISLGKCLKTTPVNLFSIKIASQLAYPTVQENSLQALLKELLNVELDNRIEQTDWTSPSIYIDVFDYLADNVRYLHKLKKTLMAISSKNDTTTPITKACKELEDEVCTELHGFFSNCE
ncbi:MAG TPA: hypothetical protein DCL21_02675 [Alphaproteobacteria bacterium]|nr:hypothetical protein [Alphaproteobacteria bacterium]